MLVVGPTPIVHFRSKKENKREINFSTTLHTTPYDTPPPPKKEQRSGSAYSAWVAAELLPISFVTICYYY
ncbi:hypothetical protein Peur_020619 [Populus x canadensis]